MIDLRERFRDLDRNEPPEQWSAIVQRSMTGTRSMDANVQRRWPAALVAAGVAAAALTFGWIAFRPAPQRSPAVGVEGTITYAIVRDDYEGQWRELDPSSGAERPSPIDADRVGRDLSPDGRHVVRFEQIADRYSLSVVDISGPTDVEVGKFRGIGAVRDQVAWAPDSDSFAFVGQDRRGEPFVRIATKEGVAKDLSIPGSWNAISWSPDARNFALVGRDADGAYGVHLAARTGGDTALLFADDRVGAERLRWSPRSDQIAVEVAESYGHPLPTDILVIGLDGSSDRLGLPGVIESSPVWSPDGSWIAFMSDRDGRSESTYDRGQTDIQGFGLYVSRRDGSEVQRLIPHRSGVRWMAPIRWVR